MLVSIAQLGGDQILFVAVQDTVILPATQQVVTLSFQLQHKDLDLVLLACQPLANPV